MDCNVNLARHAIEIWGVGPLSYGRERQRILSIRHKRIPHSGKPFASRNTVASSAKTGWHRRRRCEPGRRVSVGEIAASRCEIVLTDCLTSDRNTRLISELFEHLPQLKVVLFGMDEDPDVFLKFAFLGVSGYVLKDASAAEIISAVRGVAQGEAACPPKLCMTLIQYLSREYPGRQGYEQ